ncbi:membrane protease subunit, stomatin/prohibitin [Hymenobacter gummosus]|uniref:Membrane protease subunit, stomatin/prohibitin n=2 Tax=Hymenobacter gummosus TaxID=1776032 RepID=A0A431TUP8_9BACT|nr:membrane protease subunit, stomatin/prohibitin [Hymenobacter gummosus]
MFGLSYSKFDSMTYVIRYKNGRIAQEGRGLSFFYNTLNSSIVAIPIGSNDLPFIFNDTTNDYQSVTIQGQITYKISNPKQLAELLDFTVNSAGVYKKNDIEKLNQRLVNEAQAATSAFVHELGLKEAIRSNKAVEARITAGLQASPAVALLGIEVLGVNILAIRANPEMERALEAETRERLQQDADQAVYERRNFAVEQERRIKESELNTEIAVEEKHKQIDEKRMEAQLQRAANERQLRELQVQADIAVETQRAQLLEQQTANERQQADAQGYVLDTTLRPYRDLDWRTLVALNNNPDPRFNIALAFRELAENAGKIGTLNISPELLDSILGGPETRETRSTPDSTPPRGNQKGGR